MSENVTSTLIGNIVPFSMLFKLLNTLEAKYGQLYFLENGVSFHKGKQTFSIISGFDERFIPCLKVEGMETYSSAFDLSFKDVIPVTAFVELKSEVISSSAGIFVETVLNIIEKLSENIQQEIEAIKEEDREIEEALKNDNNEDEEGDEE